MEEKKQMGIEEVLKMMEKGLGKEPRPISTTCSKMGHASFCLSCF